VIQTLHLFRPLNTKLIDLLQVISPSDWSKKTVAGNWTVKDVASHLLDGSLRAISLYRDQWELPPSTAVTDYRSLVSYLNHLNGEWVDATRRLSPNLLMEWLNHSHEPFIQCLEKLDPAATARYSVAWAGESASTNAFHIAREYTEKWHHQQQIREAVGKQEILTREFYNPVLETFMMALPHAYRETDAEVGSTVSIQVTTDAGGNWTIEKSTDSWILTSKARRDPVTRISIPGDLAWKLFTKAIAPNAARSQIQVLGAEALAWPALRMLSVMA